MKDIKQIIADAAIEIIDGVDGISEGSPEYDKLMNQLIYIQTLNYNNDNPSHAVELPERPEPLRVGPVVRKVAAQISKNAAIKKEQEEREALEEEELSDEEASALRH